jgi:prepilin-type N-terminal cleavage/methylation domain-containing protein
MTRPRGFTLIELLTVIIIIAVMSVGIVPAYQRFVGRVSFDSMAGDIESLFAEAHSRAMADGTEVDVTFDRGSQTLLLMEQQPPLTSMDQPVALATSTPQTGMQQTMQSPTVGKIVHLGQNYRLSQFTPGSGTAATATPGTSNMVRFQDDGTCDGAQLALISAEGYSAQYILLPATGRMERIDPAGQQAGL